MRAQEHASKGAAEVFLLCDGQMPMIWAFKVIAVFLRDQGTRWEKKSERTDGFGAETSLRPEMDSADSVLREARRLSMRPGRLPSCRAFGSAS